VVRSIYDHTDPELADEFVERLGHDLQDDSCPPEIRQLGRTLLRWKDRIFAWHRAHVTNALIESTNTKIRLLTRVAFGFHGPEPLIALAMLALGGHRPNLPHRQ
jgi:transposase